MNVEEMKTILQKKYEGFVRVINLHFDSTHNIYIITWRPWVIKSNNEDTDSITFSCIKNFALNVSKEHMDNEGITDIFDEIDKTIVLSPVMAKMFASFKSHYVKVPKGLV
jgi:hypothetical protein